ncbi:DUF6194 family protein [Agromyces sp. SYSU K20354]|uniref:DUF6194 family protein n=1 Tax=Agromyces cavernae TaxID=2898659 RepID=UPI001E2A5A92|nr:DUF6194 family protein [Agromyces cavernae]MCD2442935.1 DUF6194 family protein [Agromyces cavernae]
MSMQLILETVRAFDGVLELAPGPGSGFPEIAWGDHFFYASPDGSIPSNRQPYATIVTKDYPDDALSNLDPPGRWRLNIHVGTARFAELTGESPRDFTARDFTEPDVILPHPVYGSLGWIAIVNPGIRTTTTALALLRDAHADDRGRAERRSGADDLPAVRRPSR